MSVATDSYIVELLELESLLRAYLSRYIATAADVEDLLQEAFLRLLALAPAQRSQLKSVRAFALTTARNLALDWLRHRQVVPMQLVEDFENWHVLDERASVDEIVSAHQELQAVERAIARLPRRCREIFTLRRVYGMSQREIAQSLNISESTVEAQLVKALKKFTALMGRHKDQASETDGAERAMGRPRARSER